MRLLSASADDRSFMENHVCLSDSGFTGLLFNKSVGSFIEVLQSYLLPLVVRMK